MFPFTTKFDHVKQIRHAVSLDERRTKHKQNLIYPYSYKPSFFSLKNTPTDYKSRSAASSVNAFSVLSRIQDGPAPTAGTRTGGSVTPANILKISEARRLMRDLEIRLRKIGPRPTAERRSSLLSSSSAVDKSKLIRGEFQEIWFPGNHGDVGGGWSPDVNGQFLSNLSLRWMFSEAIKAGIRFQKDELVGFAERYSSLDGLLSPVHDLLSLLKHNKTLQMTESDKQQILQISTLLYNKKKIPDFRSCAVIDDPSYQALFNSGVYLTSLRRLKNDIKGPHSTAEIFRYHQNIPQYPIQGSDGRGNNSLLETLCWWLLELIPMGTKIENKDGEWRNVYIPNLGRPRSVPDYAQMHCGVLWRMRYCTDYKPNNLPAYVVDLMNGREPVVEKDNFLLKKVIEDTKLAMLQWDLEEWRIVPDDLDRVLREMSYYN